MVGKLRKSCLRRWFEFFLSLLSVIVCDPMLSIKVFW